MLYIELNKAHKRSFAVQIYQQLRLKILGGEIKSGERLPSTRTLSEELNVSRNTVLSAYDRLVAEGYANSISGSGVYVNAGAQAKLHNEIVADYQVTSLEANGVTGDVISFDSGIPALDLFPREKWSRFVNRAMKEAPVSALGYDEPQGRPELRRVLVAYLKKARGIHCDPEQIIVTAGTKQGLTLVAKCLLNQECEIWLEDPTNSNVKEIFDYHTGQITPIPVDEEGICTDLFPRDRKPALIFVTPSHQFPMGGMLSIQRRLELAQFARDTGCYIVEDDYDSEFRYNGPPANSLFELNNQQVIYVGTFSKILFPSLRLGYLVLPPHLLEQFRKWKRLGDHHSNSISQLALMRFIECGELERHITRMRKIYAQRRSLLLALLAENFPGQFRIFGEQAGMHVVGEFDEVEFTDRLVQKLRKVGLDIVPVERHALEKGKHTNKIILGYAHLDTEKMTQGIAKLKEVLLNSAGANPKRT